MERAESPESADFLLNPAEIAELRKSLIASSGPSWIVVLNVVVGLTTAGFHFLWYGIHDLLGWFLLATYSVVIGAVIAKRYVLYGDASKPLRAKLIVDGLGVRLVRNTGAVRTIAYAQIARVRMLPSVIVVEPRWASAIAVPRRALRDDGAQLIRIFEDRLVAKRMLVRQSPSSVIVNTASP
jgi:hypothetical protein